MWHRGHEILLAISCSMALCLHDPHTQNCGSSIGLPDTIQGANLVSQLGQFVLHSVICVPHWGQSPLKAGFLSFGEFLIKLKNDLWNLFKLFKVKVSFLISIFIWCSMVYFNTSVTRTLKVFKFEQMMLWQYHNTFNILNFMKL